MPLRARPQPRRSPRRRSPLPARLFAMALLLWLPIAPAAADQRLRLGLLAPDGSFDALHTWDATLQHLAATLPEVSIDVRHLPHAALREAIRRGEIDAFIANSGFFIEAEAFGATPVATLDADDAPSPTRAIATTLVARAADDRIAAPADLRGKRVVAVHPIAFAGYQLGLHVLQGAGVPEDALQSMAFTGLPSERLLQALLDGRADAAILRSCRFETLLATQQLDPAAFKVVGAQGSPAERCARSSALYPDWPFAVLPGADAALAKRLSVALMTMPRGPQGYAWTVPTDYTPVRQVFRDLRIGPYADLRRETFAGLVHRYRHWLALAGVLLLGGLLHIVRAESLVRRRTQALRGAQAERDRMAQESRARERQLEHLSRLSVLGEMSSMLAHELNQPLSAIGNFARGIVRRIEGGRADLAVIADAGDQIALQAERAAGILQRVRDFARNRPGERAEVDLRTACEEAIALFRDLMPGAPDLRCEFATAGPALVWADRLQISQLLTNLIKNAAEATAALPRERRRVRIVCRREANLYRVEVVDNGAGLQALPLHSLFEPFSTTKSGGLGLGLAICRRVVEAHGGRIVARSNDPEPGLTVAFTLPAAGDAPRSLAPI